MMTKDDWKSEAQMIEHFVANARRAARAKKRHPSQGFAFIDDSAFAGEHPGALQHAETPDELFHRTWLQELVLRVLKRLERACHAAGRDTHYELFRRHLVAPALEGVDAPPLRELAAAAGLPAKDAANRILTVQRAFRRLLKEAQILTCLFVPGKAGRGACPVSRDRLRSTPP